MGTNYYMQEKPPCECCGRPFESKHIGKSSAGWCFSLHVDDEIPDLEHWIRLWTDETVILDEYGTRVSVNEMLKVITERKGSGWDRAPIGYDSWADFHANNHSEKGPSGLLRHRIDRFCVGHGAGTWDNCIGEFS